MKNYIIRWNAGYGEEYEEVTAASASAAEKIAKDRWKAEVEANADYGVECEATKETREDYL